MEIPKDALTMVAIADRLEEAAYTLRRLPKVTVEGFKSNWPPTINEFHEAYGYNDATVRLGPPTARHITEMDEALSWILLLEPVPDYSRKLVWLRANGVRWKAIQRRFGHSRTKLHLDWRNAIHTILRGLEARKVRLPCP
jgi:Domain of unknown function (DUF6362)